MQERLSGKELSALIRSVFSPGKEDSQLAILIDLPDETVMDNDLWRQRRMIAFDWHNALRDEADNLDLTAVDLIAYGNVHSNNADLPDHAFVIRTSPEKLTADDLARSGRRESFETILSGHQLVIALTEFSATAPLKLLSKKMGFRAATMPGFSGDMIPALRLDYEEVNRRVHAIKEKLDPSTGMEIKFTVSGNEIHTMYFDLRHRIAQASGGRFPDAGTAGNLPSGECYIVPYEGELEDESRSRGTLPVQFDEEVVLYRIEKNKAVDILSEGTYSEIEKEKIKAEPAYANISELGFGVLKDFGCTPTGVILLDEKLGLHIAFGRSDHFGGAVGVKDFSSPEKVVHIDRIYIPETQSKVQADYVKLIRQDGTTELLMENGSYILF